MEEGLALETLEGPQSADGGLAQKLDRETYVCRDMISK